MLIGMLKLIKSNYKRLIWETIVLVAVSFLFGSVGAIVLGTRFLGIMMLSYSGGFIGALVGGALWALNIERKEAANV